MLIDRLRIRHILLGLLGWSYLAFAYMLPLAAPSQRSGFLAALTRCPFLQLTGIECPLCGLTRSWHALLHGDLAAAFAFNRGGPFLLPLWMVASAAFSAVALKWNDDPRIRSAFVRRQGEHRGAMLPNERCTWRGPVLGVGVRIQRRAAAEARSVRPPHDPSYDKQ